LLRQIEDDKVTATSEKLHGKPIRHAFARKRSLMQ
jgi:hypothetical protein